MASWGNGRRRLRGRRRPAGRWRGALLVLGLVVLFLTRGQLPFLPGGPAAESPDPPYEDFLFLFIWESSSQAWRVQLLDPLDEPLITFDPVAPSLTVAQEKLPDSGGPLLVHLRGDGMGIPFRDRLLAPWPLPAQLPIDAPVVQQVQLVGEEAPSNGVDNSRRHLAGPILVELLEPDGTVQLAYGGTRLRLAPGEGWGEARIQGEDGALSVLPVMGPEWEATLSEQLAAGEGITVLRIYNYGRWPRAVLEEVAGDARD